MTLVGAERRGLASLGLVDARFFAPDDAAARALVFVVTFRDGVALDVDLTLLDVAQSLPHDAEAISRPARPVRRERTLAFRKAAHSPQPL